MVATPIPPRQQMEAWFNQVNQRLSALEQQQQSVITNAVGQPIIATGLVPGSNPAEYGYIFLNPATSMPLAFFGENGSGNMALYYFNSAGGVASQYDAEGLHFYDTSGNEVVRIDSLGLHVYDDTMTEQVAAGLLNSSPAQYGLGVLPYGGTELQLVGGVLEATGANETGVTSTSWTNVSGSTVTAEIGPSGQAQVQVSVQTATGGAGQEGLCGIVIDGGSPAYGTALIDGAGSILASVQSTIVLGGLSAGTHTFGLAVKVLGASANCSFYTPTITVQPL